jgi:truncated hemoglobin YjbI
MNIRKISNRQLLPTIIIAFIAGYFFNWLIKEHLLSSDYLFTWLGASTTIAAIVGAFVLGVRQNHILCEHVFQADAQSMDRKRTSFLVMASAANSTIVRLSDHYRNTHQDRMRIRAVYHSDTFASLIEALAAIPVHELDSLEAAVALAGLKKNMLDAQRVIEPFIAAKNKPDDDALSAVLGAGLDLRMMKIYAASHYEQLAQALKKS